MSPSDLPSIHGLDIRAGLMVVRGNEALYRKLLLRFREQQIHFADEFEQANAVDPQTATRLAHSLKGVAGNLGALRLQHLAESLEQACKSGGPIANELQALLAELTPLLNDLGKLEHT